MKITLITLSILLGIFGIVELIVTYNGFQIYQGLMIKGNHSFTHSPFVWEWDYFWALSNGWMLGLSALISGMIIYKKASKIWSFTLSTCIIHVVYGLITLYSFQTRNIRYSELNILFESDFYTYKAIQISIATLGLVILLLKSSRNYFDVTTKDAFWVAVISVILGLIVLVH